MFIRSIYDDYFSWASDSIVYANHPLSIRILALYNQLELIESFHCLLAEIRYRRRALKDPVRTAGMVETLENIMELVFRDHGGWAFLNLEQEEQYFLQQMQQQNVLTLPELNFTITQQPQQSIEYRQQVATPMMGQAPSQDIIQRQLGAPVANQQQADSNQDKDEIFLERFNKENEHNEKMKNRYADELALKARAELEAEEKKAIEIEKENARKLKEAEERLRKTRIENERKEETVMRTDEAINRADELQRQVREMAERAEQEKRDSERRIEERRREAAARREQDRQCPLNNSRSQTDEWDRKRSNYDHSHMQRSFTDRTIERGYGERELCEKRDISENNLRFDDENKREDDYKQRMLPEIAQNREPTPALQKYITHESDDDDSDSDEEKRKDPYKLIGLPDRQRTPLKDIETTKRVLDGIHQKAIEAGASEAARKHAEKRLVEIKWAADILLDEMNKRAFDEDGAIYPHEQQNWKKKNGYGDAGSGKYIPG